MGGSGAGRGRGRGTAGCAAPARGRRSSEQQGRLRGGEGISTAVPSSDPAPVQASTSTGSTARSSVAKKRYKTLVSEKLIPQFVAEIGTLGTKKIAY